MRNARCKALINGLLVAIAIISTTLFCLKFKIIIVSGDSMDPSLKDGQIILASRDIDSIKISDIVVFENSNELCIKRVIATQGDEIVLKDEGVFVNGVRVAEVSYNGEFKEYNIGEDELFVLGDNEKHSYDSRDYGPIKKESIKCVYR